MSNSTYKSPYHNWRGTDVFKSIFLFFGACLTLTASGGVMYTTLINSGEIAYIEQPLLAIFISSLSICAGIAIKSIPMTFTHKENKLLYLKGLFGTTGVTVIFWIYLFANTVDGMGSGFSVNGLLEQDTDGSSTYTFVQILAEILIGASLFSAWQLLHDSYNPEKLVNNPLIPVLDGEIAELKASLDAVSDDVQKVASKMSFIKTARSAFINRQLEALTLFKARHSVTRNLLGDNDHV